VNALCGHYDVGRYDVVDLTHGMPWARQFCFDSDFLRSDLPRSDLTFKKLSAGSQERRWNASGALFSSGRTLHQKAAVMVLFTLLPHHEKWKLKFAKMTKLISS
jgi:hypothetical protein